MSFFIKGKRKKDVKTQKKGGRKLDNSAGFAKKAKRIKGDSDEEISSDSDEEVELNHHYTQSSDDEGIETAQEKKLRLAKKYLEDIEKEEKKRLEADDVDKDVIASRLKDEELLLAGKLRKRLADNIVGFDDPCILRCKEHSRTMTCLIISPDNAFIYTASDDFNIVKWSLTNKNKDSIIKRTDGEGHKKKILALAVSNDLQFLVSGGADAKIHIWDAKNLTHINLFSGHKIDVTGLAFQKGTRQLFSCSSDKTVKVWNLDEMMYVETLYGHQAGITSIDVLNKERAITAGGRDNTLRLWKVVEESHLVLNGHKNALDCVRLVDESHMISGGEDGYVCLWSSLKKKPLHSIADAHGTGSWIVSIASCPYTDIFATGSYNGEIQVYKIEENYRSFSRLLTIPVEGSVNSLAFTSDGLQLVAAIGKEHRLGRWVTIKSARNSIVVISFKTNK